MLIFEAGSQGRKATAQMPVAEAARAALDDLPDNLLRKKRAVMPEVSELQAVRHYTRLSQKNFSIDTHFYPLGSCTMKYNPRACNTLAMLPAFLERHPLAPEEYGQGMLQCLWELQEMLADVTGMAAVSLAPMAGAQGEFAGVAMIRAYHDARGDTERTEIIVPDAAHGTNPATAVMCGYEVREIATGADGDIDMAALHEAVGPQTAGIMLTNPSTVGVFERRIVEVAELIHEAGGLLYYDGANLNAVLGKVRPGDMGFDVMHMNLHKTFSTPHGGGGPGAGAIGVGPRLEAFRPIPVVAREAVGAGAAQGRGYAGKAALGEVTSANGATAAGGADAASRYRWLDERDIPQTIGRLSGFGGNMGVLLRAYVYARMLGREGMPRVAEFATLNANYLMTRLRAAGFQVAYPARRASHEFIISLKQEAKELGCNAMDFAKRLLDYGYHAPTTYFPLLVPEALLIEPSETESKESLDGFVEAMIAIRKEAETSPDTLKGAPYTLPVRRLDDVKAAKDLDIGWAG